MRQEIVQSNIPQLPVRSHTGVYQNDSQCNLHMHEDIELLYVKNGPFYCTVDDRTYEMAEGDTVFINSRIPHETSGKRGTSVILVQFKPERFTEAGDSRIIRYSISHAAGQESRIAVLHDPELGQAVVDVNREGFSELEANSFFVRSAIYRILGILYRNHHIVNPEALLSSRDAQRLMPALRYINENYPEDITLASISAQIGFEESYTCRLFRSAIGTTFTEYLNFVRIYQAERLLTHTDKSILEIACEVGFSSSSYFTRVFRRFKYCSPGVYRNVQYAHI